MLCGNCGALIVEFAANCPYCRQKIESRKDHPRLDILLVEDDDELRELLERWFIMANLNVTAVSNGKDALEEYKKHNFDLALVDVDLPFISGIEVARTIKNNTPNLPVLLCTAYVKSLIEEDVEAAHVDGFITKPIELDYLLLTIQNLTIGGPEPLD